MRKRRERSEAREEDAGILLDFEDDDRRIRARSSFVAGNALAGRVGCQGVVRVRAVATADTMRHDERQPRAHRR